MDLPDEAPAPGTVGLKPAEAAPFADPLRCGATNPWGSFDGFRSGLEGEAANLSVEIPQAAYAAGEPGRQFGWQAGWATFYWAWWIASRLSWAGS